MKFNAHRIVSIVRKRAILDDRERVFPDFSSSLIKRIVKVEGIPRTEVLYFIIDYQIDIQPLDYLL